MGSLEAAQELEKACLAQFPDNARQQTGFVCSPINRVCVGFGRYQCLV